eukprot:scaffold225_cov111-Isochrysis_galbana.AAC.6
MELRMQLKERKKIWIYKTDTHRQPDVRALARLRLGSGCGCSLYPPPSRSPRLEHAPPRLQQR